jgi:hypothetical protein
VKLKFAIFAAIFILLPIMPVRADAGLDALIAAARKYCGGLSAEFSAMKNWAQAGTIATGVGTATGIGAVAAGVAKSKHDVAADEARAKYDALYGPKSGEAHYYLSYDADEFNKAIDNWVSAEMKKEESVRESKENLQAKINAEDKKSKSLGDLRTGLVAATGVTGTASAVMNVAGAGRMKSDLASQLNECRRAVDAMQKDIARVRFESGTDDPSIPVAEKIARECADWDRVDASKINSWANVNLISAALAGAGGITGAIVSANANSGVVRNDNSETGVKKEAGLNNTAQKIAIGAAAASGVATVAGAVQISAIQKAFKASDKCEEGLK